MFRIIKKWYFKIYHLFKLLGIFILIFGLKENVYAETNKYYIKNGKFEENYTFNNTGGSTNYGYIQENYNNEGYVLISARTWSAWNLNFNNNEIETGDIINITYKRKAIWTGQYGNNAVMELKNKEVVKKTLFSGTENNYNDYVTKNYTSEENGTFTLYIANLANTTDYINYGVEVKDVWITKINEEPQPEGNIVYDSFLNLYTEKLEYLANGFTNNPYLLAMIGIIFSFIVLEITLKLFHMRGGK